MLTIAQALPTPPLTRPPSWQDDTAGRILPLIVNEVQIKEAVDIFGRALQATSK